MPSDNPAGDPAGPSGAAGMEAAPFSTRFAVPEGWGAHRMPDMTGRLAVVTGANTGLGLCTARELARAGADVVLAVRSPARGKAAAASIMQAAPRSRVEVRRLDLADLASVRRFADGFLDAYPALDVLVNNAGIMAPPYRTTADGFESQFGTNHLGHFALTGRLMPALAAATAARVVTVSSDLHSLGRLDFHDLQSRRRYRRLRAYGTSKLANLLFTAELDRRAAAAGLPLRAYAAHPGFAATSLTLTGRSAPVRLLMTVPNTLVAVSPAQGAVPLLCAAALPDLPGGVFLGPGSRSGMRGSPAVLVPKDNARDRPTAVRLWEVSQSLTQVVYDFAATGRGARPAPRS
ncbi:oxidoreductase [Streptomyces sp. HPF1205]|uniref:oxidoreductase n=1 Tax=Streptomyces sp. HPF1205 TaxID=2873262 RepID=UPI001CECEF77|nr:oxidoreductase [Streptomyces sp. HPF1205]